MSELLLLSFIFLLVGVLFVPLASRLGLGSVLGYLLAGVAISPLLARLHIDLGSIQSFAEFGVVMMLFLVGLELEPKRLWKMRTSLIGLGSTQIFGTALVIMGIGIMVGLSWQMALAIGLVLALSSTAIVLQTLQEKGLMRSDAGQATFSVLLFQDIAVIPMLILIPLLATLDPTQSHAEVAGHGAGLNLTEGLSPMWATFVALGAIAAVIVVGILLVPPLFRFIESAKLRELFTAAALMIVIGIALLMSLVGLSPALGTFLAGVVLANSEYRHELESDVAPFKGLLLGLFFITVGANINFQKFFENWLLILGLTAGLIAVKFAVLYVLGIVFKIRGSDRWLFALGLAQTGEFAFVLLSFVVLNNVVPKEIADLLLLVVAFSMFLTPALFVLHDKLVAPFFLAVEPEADEIDQSNNIILVGHGRVGGIVSRMLRAIDIPFTVIDYSQAQLEMLKLFNVKAFYGDGTRFDLLHAAGIADAKMIVVATDTKDSINTIVRYVAKNYPNVHILARAIDRQHVYDLYAAGCRDIVRDTYDSALRMGRSAFEALGIEHDVAEKMKTAFDEMDREFMLEAAEVYDPTLSIFENKAYVDKINKFAEIKNEELRVKMQNLRKKA